MNTPYNHQSTSLRKIVTISLSFILTATVVSSPAYAMETVVKTKTLLSGKHYTVKAVTLSSGTELEQATINGPPKPPAGFEVQRQSVSLPTAETASASSSLTVPAYSWVFGCSAVSGAMIAGYYDRNGYPNIYTGPTDSGVMPLTNASWPTWSDGSSPYPNNPLVASKDGVDGRSGKGSIDDYWVQYNSTASDPYITGSWTQHTWGTAIGDYMKTSQSAYGNTDGSSHFWNYSSTTPLLCSSMPSMSGTVNTITNTLSNLDATYGRKLFYEARGYTVTDCYNQKTDNNGGGFTFAMFKSEIDAGHPVLLNLAGHSIVGVGYDESTSPATIYIHDTWDDNNHTMSWGGSYSGMALQSVSIVNLASPFSGSALLTVSKTGNGTVTSSPYGISCGGTCSYTFGTPQTVVLTATADSGSIFTGWSGGGCSGTGTCVVSLADNTTVTATFATTTLGEALNIPGITVTTSGSANWFPESSTTHDDSSAAQSGDINDNQTSSMQFTVHGPGTLSFWWKVSSELSWDKLKFYIDGAEPTSTSGGISGNVDWTQVSGITIPTGTHTLSWTYSKDGSVSSGSDTGWVDQIFMEHTIEVFIQGAGSGNVLMNPYSINCSTSGGCATNYNLGTLVTLIATPSGSSTFGGWSGCTTPSGTTCNLIMDERKYVTATFNSPNKVKILNGASYETISDGYEAANSGDVIMLVQDTFNSDLTLNLNKAVTLSGGWYPDFNGLTGLYSYLQGILTISGGSLTVENIVIK